MANQLSNGNKYIVCQYVKGVANIGVWLRRNPLNYSLSLTLLQLSVISVTSMLIEACLHPLGQSSIVAQILSGVLFGPSALGHQGVMGGVLFPARSAMLMETVASWGIMYFLFAVGVRTDTRAMVRPSKQSVVIGLSAMLTTLVFSSAFCIILKTYIPMDDSLGAALPFMAAAQCLTPFPNVSCLLIELKMASSELGRIACSTAIFCDLLGMTILAVTGSLQQSNFEPVKTTYTLSSIVLLVGILVYVVRPLLLRVVKRIPIGKPLSGRYVYMCFVGVLIVGLASELVGQHFVPGPFVFGFVVPDGPALGTPIISKLDLPIGKLLYPTFLTTSGLKTNIFKIDMRSSWVVALLIMFACVTKVSAVVFASRFFSICFLDSVIIGLMLNARGICELLMFNLWRDGGVLTDQEFALSIMSVIAVTAIITPLIKLLYDPSKRLVPLRRRTIQHCKHGTDLRILVCIHNQDNVPSIINLLEASHAEEESPITVIAVLLEELVNQATQMLVAHQSTRMLRPTNSRSGHIIKALRQYETCNERCVTVQSFSAMSHFQTVHDDVCRVAIDQNATMIILPFHRRWEIDGSMGSADKAIRNMNIKVMDKSPCSVAILVDRGVLTGSLSILNNQSRYHIAIIFIGGPDDVESLSYAARMARHNNVVLTIIRYLFYGCDSARERKLDNSLIDGVRMANMENLDFTYREQVVRDGVGLAQSLRGLENNFDLLIVGRNHQTSEIMTGLGTWSECPELGVVGDILSSSDIGSTASVLIVQQQRIQGDKMMNRMTKPAVISHESAHELRFEGPMMSSDRDTRLEMAKLDANFGV